MHLTHPTSAKRRENLVSADLSPGERWGPLRINRAQVFGFKLPRIHNQRVSFDEALDIAFIAQQLFDLAAQVGVVRAGLSEKPLSHARLALKRGVIERFDLAPALFVERHFFTPAVQLVHTVSGAFGSFSTTALIKNRCPSPVTAYGGMIATRVPARKSKSETAT